MYEEVSKRIGRVKSVNGSESRMKVRERRIVDFMYKRLGRE